ncbi:hypothetical protein CPI83_30110 (plasmid) [Rhodococcus sp. H-CA8f]|uniref:hypothetical protein n=1 Tax=Rhodococcus sp. H-CA8f TaxID=1727214 RepID=UPI000BE3787A|nr:hypothetical protein [Rhodococcus sp. H-CA8f]ATI36452.1 hypothetical protein CPI83_30110 [Rhodococcus sp. H-CA8f]
MADNWPIPAGLSKEGKEAAEVIRTLLVEKGLTDHGGGGQFYTPQQWRDREEEYGLGSQLIITHDGGDHAAAFNPDYGDYALMEELRLRLDRANIYPEQCTSWYTAIYTR